jgi:ADP-ribose pyrophosphatase YjhB (NUDIX family)
MEPIKLFDDFVNESFLEERFSAGLCIVYNKKVLLAHTTGRNFRSGYGIPKGGIEAGENQIDAAIRETFEEIGVNVPKKLINSSAYTFAVTSNKHKFNKIVYYYLVEIDTLDQIGLSSEVVPKSKLQIEEINDARFMDRDSALKVTMQSQLTVISTLTQLGLI